MNCDGYTSWYSNSRENQNIINRGNEMYYEYFLESKLLKMC